MICWSRRARGEDVRIGKDRAHRALILTKMWRQRRSSSTHCQSISLRRQSSTLVWRNLSIPTKLMIDTISSKSLNGSRKRALKRTTKRPRAKIRTLSYCHRSNHVILILASSSSLMKHSSEWGLNPNKLKTSLKFMISWHLPPSIKNQYLCHCMQTRERNHLNINLTISNIAGTHKSQTKSLSQWFTLNFLISKKTHRHLVIVMSLRFL